MSPGDVQMELFDRLTYEESTDVEYKSARGGLPGSLWETYSAFANTDGGSILLGVVQRDGELDIQGVADPEKLLADFWSTLNNRSKVSINLLGNDAVQKIAVPGKPEHNVLHISVPRAARGERPVYIGTDPLSGTYRRNHDGDYRCTADEVRRMYADRPDHPGDSRILVGFTTDDLDPESIQQFRNRFSSMTPGHPWLKEDDHGLLMKLGALRVARAEKTEGVTAAGLLMFGRMQAITAPEAFPGFHLDYRERFSEDPNVRWSDRVTVDGTWEPNLFQFYQRIILKLSSGPGVRQPFQLDEEGYRRHSTPVHEALKEALVNALIHADYSGQGGVVIDRHLNRFEFSNPGTLLISREQLQAGGISECRNKCLQGMFQRLGAVDKAGSGIDKIRSSWKDQHWQSPTLRETRGPDRVQLLLPMISTLPDGVVAELRHRFAEVFDSLTADEIQTLVTAEVEGNVSNQRLQEMLAVHRADITRLLRGLVQRGLLIPDGTGRGTRYTVSTGSSIGLEANSIGNDSSSIGNDSNSIGKDPNSIDLDPSQDPRLLEIAQPIREAERARPDLVRKVVLSLCLGRYLSLRDLAQLLDRSPVALRNGYLRDMVQAGQLELQFPDTPSHRLQAYRTRI